MHSQRSIQRGAGGKSDYKDLICCHIIEDFQCHESCHDYLYPRKWGNHEVHSVKALFLSIQCFQDNFKNIISIYHHHYHHHYSLYHHHNNYYSLYYHHHSLYCHYHNYYSLYCHPPPHPLYCMCVKRMWVSICYGTGVEVKGWLCGLSSHLSPFTSARCQWWPSDCQVCQTDALPGEPSHQPRSVFQTSL